MKVLQISILAAMSASLLLVFQNCGKPLSADLANANADIAIDIQALGKSQPARVDLALQNDEEISQLSVGNTGIERVIEPEQWSYDRGTLTITDARLFDYKQLAISIRKRSDIECVRAPCNPNPSPTTPPVTNTTISYPRTTLPPSPSTTPPVTNTTISYPPGPTMTTLSPRPPTTTVKVTTTTIRPTTTTRPVTTTTVKYSCGAGLISGMMIPCEGDNRDVPVARLQWIPVGDSPAACTSARKCEAYCGQNFTYDPVRKNCKQKPLPTTTVTTITLPVTTTTRPITTTTVKAKYP